MTTDRALSATLKQRIQLWSRVRQETEEGDLTDTWLPVSWVWAKVRVRPLSDSDKQDAMRLEIVMRPTSYRFHGIMWKGKSYHVMKGICEDPENHTLRYFVRQRSGF